MVFLWYNLIEPVHKGTPMKDSEVIEKAAEKLGLTLKGMFLLVAKSLPVPVTDPEAVADSWLKRYKRERIPHLIKFCQKTIS